MRIVIGRPQSWIDRSKKNPNSIWFGDVETLYDNIEIACEELNIPFNVLEVDPPKIRSRSGEIFLGHHSYGKQKNVWHLKKGYLPFYMYWDKYGYSGWSELAEKYDPDNHISVPSKIINLVNYFIDNKISKIGQPDTTTNLPKKEFILVLSQRPYDSVATHAYIRTEELSVLVNEAYKNTKYVVLTKPHPMCRKYKIPGRTIEGNIHDIIPKAKAVYTVNSGTGLESLFYKKRVFVSGNSDYKWGCTLIKNYEDIVNTMELINEDIDEIKLYHFLYYLFFHHFVECDNLESVKNKIKRCVEEYEV